MSLVVVHPNYFTCPMGRIKAPNVTVSIYPHARERLVERFSEAWPRARWNKLVTGSFERWKHVLGTRLGTTCSVLLTSRVVAAVRYTGTRPSGRHEAAVITVMPAGWRP